MSELTELSQEKSEKLAQQISLIAFHLNQIDYEYLKLAAQKMFEQANHQDAMLVLSPSNSQISKNELVHEQARALKKLSEYVDLLKKIDELKSQLSDLEKKESEIEKLFL